MNGCDGHMTRRADAAEGERMGGEIALTDEMKASLFDLLAENAHIGVFCSVLSNIYGVAYANEAYYRLHGFEKGEFERETGNSIMPLLFDEDREIVRREMEAHLASGNRHPVFEYRVRKRDGSVGCFKTAGTICERENAEPLMLGIVSDVTDSKLAEMRIGRLNEEMAQTYNTIPGGAFRCRFNEDWDVLFANDGLFRFLGYTREEFAEICGNKMSSVIYEEDKAPMAPRLVKQLESGPTIHNINRLVCKDGTVKWISIHAELAEGEDGVPYFHCVFVDISEQKRIEAEMQALISNIPGGVIKLELRQGELHHVYTSEGVAAMLGYDHDELLRINDEGLCRLVHPDDVDAVRAGLEKAMRDREPFDSQYRLRRKDGRYLWVSLMCNPLVDENDGIVFYGAYTDITQIKETERALRESEERYAISASNTGMNVWEYDVATRTILQSPGSLEKHGLSAVIEDVPHSLVRDDFVREDCREAFLDMYERILAGEDKVGGDFWVKCPDGRGYWLERIVYTVIKDVDGNPIKAYGSSRDVTEDVMRQRRFEEELAYREQIEKTVLSTMRINLSTGTIEDRSCEGELVERDVAYDEAYLDETTSHITDEAARERTRKLFSVENLLAQHRRGVGKVSDSVIVRFGDSSIRWVDTTAHLVSRPATGDVVAFMYARDITQEKTLSDIMNVLLRDSFEAVVCVDSNSETCSLYAGERIPRDSALRLSAYSRVIEEYCAQTVCASDADRVLRTLRLEDVIENLAKGAPVTVEFDAVEANGSRRRKRVTCQWLDEKARTMLFICTDIHDVLLAEKRSNRRFPRLSSWRKMRTTRKASSSHA